MTVPKCNWQGGNKNNSRTIEAQIVQKLKNNGPRPKFTGSCKKKREKTYPRKGSPNTDINFQCRIKILS